MLRNDAVIDNFPCYSIVIQISAIIILICQTRIYSMKNHFTLAQPHTTQKRPEKGTKKISKRYL